MDTTTTSQAQSCGCEPGAHDTGEPGGFYVTVKDGGRTGWLLGPYGTHQEAIDLVPDGKRLAKEADQWAAFYAFGTSRIREGKRPAGVLNGRLAAARRTPGYNCRLTIWFTTTTAGKPRAWYIGRSCMRAFPLRLADAEIMRATETADVVCCHPWKPHTCGK